MINQVALVSQTNRVTLGNLTTAAAALQKQVNRDLRPIWGIDASVNAFASLDDVPLGYWPVIIDDTIPFDAAGIHLNNDNGQPYALVAFSSDWTLTTSHEVLEMLVDPSGNRTMAANSPKRGQGRVLILVEVCDPSEAAKFGYSVNGVLVSDFYTPDFFSPVNAPGVRYSFTGAIRKPIQVLDGGYISWWDPASRHVFQLFVNGSRKEILDRGPLPQGFSTLRSFTDRFTNERRKNLSPKPPAGLMLTAAVGSGKPEAKQSEFDLSSKYCADSLRAQIGAVVQSLKK